MLQPTLMKRPEREYRTWVLDSRRWENYRPRSDDVIIATYPKCGTTWTQRIVGLLVFQSPEPKPIMKISAWIDRRFGPPIEEVTAQIEAQEHRRFLKTHLPLDGLPFYSKIKYIHVGRDGRDVCMSYHNHLTGLTASVLELLDRIGLGDEKIGRPFPRPPADPADFFHRWVRGENATTMPFFHFQRSWWEERHQPNVLLVHYNDLKADLSGEMMRIANFLGIAVSPGIWPDLVAAAGFDSMRKAGNELMANMAEIFEGGGQRFFHKGCNKRWQGVFRDDDLALYDVKVREGLPPECARWLAHGRLDNPDNPAQDQDLTQ